MTGPTRIEQFLLQYPCGPGGHNFQPTGETRAVYTVDGGPSPDQFQALTACSVCGKSGLVSTPTCTFCDEDYAEQFPRSVLVGPDGQRVAAPELCDHCRVDLDLGLAGGWRLEPGD